MAMFRFPSDLTHIRTASNKVLEFLSDLQLDDSLQFDVRLCFEEALINAIKHGNKLNKQLTVDVDVLKKNDTIEIVVCDQGSGFDYQNPHDPTAEENLEKSSGRGVFLIKNLMDRVSYEKNGRCVRMIKKIR